jgi:hypothetical protein
MFRRPGVNFVRAMSILVAVCAAAGVGAAPQTPPQTPPAAAQTPLPPARDIVGRNVAAIGGTDVWSKISSYRAVGTFEIVDQKISGTVEFLRARPGKFVTRVTSDLGNSERGYDGKVGWTLDRSGPVLLTGRMLREIAEEANLDLILHDPSIMKELMTVERTRFDNRPVYKVRAVFTSGTQQLEYYDTETGLILGVEGSRELPAPFGIIPTVITFRDYKVFGGVKFPTTWMQRSIGLMQVFKWTSYEFDGVPASAFDLPPAVKALVR